MAFSEVKGPEKLSFDLKEKRRNMIKVIYAFLIIQEYSYFPWQCISSDLRDICDFTLPPHKSSLEVKNCEHLGFLKLWYLKQGAV